MSLKKYWWHRLSVVSFGLIIIGSGLYFWTVFLKSDEQPWQQCFDSAWAVYHIQSALTADNYRIKVGYDNYGSAQRTADDNLLEAQTSADHANLQTSVDKCEAEYPFHQLSEDLPLTVISMLILSYVLQLIYYKVIIYIIFGDDYDSLKQ